MDVEWQLYSVDQGRVVARIPTHGEFKVGLSSDGRIKLLRGVFSQNAQAFAKSSELKQALTGIAASSAPTAAAPSAGELRIALASRDKPVAMSQASKAVVSIFAGNAMGSGFLISPEGYLLTNYHVAGDSGRVRVRWPDGTEGVGEVVRADRRRDVALVKTAAKAEPLAIRHSPTVLGETVFAIGTPREKEFAGTLTRGVVSNVERKLEGQNYIQSDVAVTHGNSGGPLLDEKGFIVGLAQSVYEPDGVGQNINFFVPIEEAVKALALKPTGP
jgi:serine protease Do